MFLAAKKNLAGTTSWQERPWSLEFLWNIVLDVHSSNNEKASPGNQLATSSDLICAHTWNQML
jgi:hypothetical protein